jgi:hypothetical protein
MRRPPERLIEVRREFRGRVSSDGFPSPCCGSEEQSDRGTPSARATASIAGVSATDARYVQFLA